MSKLRGHGKESCEKGNQERGRPTRGGKIRKWESLEREKSSKLWSWVFGPVEMNFAFSYLFELSK